MSVCDALFQLQQWPVTIVLESGLTNSIDRYSHGKVIDEIDWVTDLIEFQKQEKMGGRDTSMILVGIDLIQIYIII